MRQVRIGNDIRIEWPVAFDGGTELLGKLGLRVEVRSSEAVVDWRNYVEQPTLAREERIVVCNGDRRLEDDCEHHPRGSRHGFGDTPRHCARRPMGVFLDWRIEDSKVIALWPASKQFACGEYDIILYARKELAGQAVCDQCRFVRLVPHTAMADGDCGDGIEAVVSLKPLTLEISGLSAYDIAVKNGFTGTEQEWLASLHGAAMVLAFDGYVERPALSEGKCESPDVVFFDESRITFIAAKRDDAGTLTYYPDWDAYRSFVADAYGTKEEGRKPVTQRMYYDEESDTLCYWDGGKLRKMYEPLSSVDIEEAIDAAEIDEALTPADIEDALNDMETGEVTDDKALSRADIEEALNDMETGEVTDDKALSRADIEEATAAAC